MATQILSMPLFSDSFYSYTVNLEDQSYKFQMQWNERAEIWTFSLYLEDDTPVVLGERLVPNYPILSEYYIDGLTGFLFLTSNSEINSEQYITYARQLDQYYSLAYVWDDGK